MKLEALARQKMDTVTVEAPTNPAPDLLGTEVGTAGLSAASKALAPPWSFDEHETAIICFFLAAGFCSSTLPLLKACVLSLYPPSMGSSE